MNKKILVIAGILVALSGLIFAMPLTILGAVACPGNMCVTHMGNEREFQGGGGQSGWKAPDKCYVGDTACNDPMNGCCKQCANWGYTNDYIVGYCGGNDRCAGVYNEMYDYDCEV